MKKWTYAAIGGAVIAMTLSVAVIATNNKIVLKTKAGSPEYTLVLDDTNSPNVSGQSDVTKDFSEYISIRYQGTSMSTKTGRHIVMGSGTISNTKQIRGITNIKVTAPVNNNNTLAVYVGYTLEDIAAKKYAYSVVGTNQVSIDTDCNFFSICGSATFGLSNVTITYDCPSDLSKPEAPTDPDTQKLVYGGTKKALTINNGAGTFIDCQTVVTDANGLPYSYKYATFSVEFNFPTAVVNSTTDYNFGLQAQKCMNADGSPSAAFQFGMTNFSTGAWAMKVSGTAQDSGTLASPLVANTWYEFKVEITAGSTYTLKCYIDGELISNTSRGSLGRNAYNYGMRFGQGSLGTVSFRNMSLTGHN